MDPTIVINARYSTRPQTGVERFAAEISRRLGPNVRIVRPGGQAPAIAGHLWEQFRLPREVAPGDILWSPANTGPLRVPNQVVTIHDISPLEHPEWFRGSFRRWYAFLLPRLARVSQKITTDSQFSKGRIVEVLGVPEERVAVVPAAVDPESFKPASPGDREATRIRFGLRGDFLLTVGTLEPRKNLNGLLEAWRRSSLASQGLQLAVAGTGQEAVHREGVLPVEEASVRLLGYVPEIYLPSLYSEAILFVYPSLYEGFGLPVLEAMACGAAVVTSNTTALPEVAGDAAGLVNPLNPAEIADRIRELVEAPSKLESMREASAARARDFSWEASAAMISSLLRPDE